MLNVLDVCTPCYFQGSPHTVYCCPVDRSMTVEQCIDGIVDDIWAHMDQPEGMEGVSDDELRQQLREQLFGFEKVLASLDEPGDEDYYGESCFLYVAWVPPQDGENYDD